LVFKRGPLIDIQKRVGRGANISSIVTSLAITIATFFYVYIAASFFRATVNILQDRVVYITTFEKYVINEDVDQLAAATSAFLWMVISLRGKLRIIVSAVYGLSILISFLPGIHFLLSISALLSIPVIISFSLLGRLTSKSVINKHATLTVTYLAAFGSLIGVASVIISALPFIFSVPSESLGIRNFAYEIYTILSVFSPFLMFLLVFCLPVRLIVNAIIPKIGLRLVNGSLESTLRINKLVKPKGKIVLLIFTMIISVVMVLIPHLPTINPDDQRVGADTFHYIRWIASLTNANSAYEFLIELFAVQNGDRPLALLVLYAAVKIANLNPSFTLEVIAPMIFGPALILVTYILTRELFPKNDAISLLAAFLTSVSFQTLIGIFAGFYANWFAIIIGYLSLIFLLRSLIKPVHSNLITFSILLTATLFIHVYTWTILAIVTSIFLFVGFKLNYSSRRTLTTLLLIVLSTAIVDVIKSTITGAPTGYVHTQIADTIKESFLVNFDSRWNNISETLAAYAGQFGNFIMLILGVFWIFLSNLRDKSSSLLIAFLSVGAFPVFFGDWVSQSRVFYDIPFQILAAVGLTYIMNLPNGKILFLSISSWLLAISLRSVPNFLPR
jgi:hypothetical protein